MAQISIQGKKFPSAHSLTQQNAKILAHSPIQKILKTMTN